MTEAEAVVLTLEELKTCMEYWQRALRMQDWKIELQIVPRKDFIDDQRTASSSWWQRCKDGEIKVLSETSYKSEAFIDPQDMEVSLVHELLHGQLDRLDIEAAGLRRDALEQAITLTAQALVKLRRQAAAAS